MVLKIEGVLERMQPDMATRGEEMVKKIGYLYHLDVMESKGKEPVTFTIDLKNGKGSIKKGKHDKPDCTFTLLDEDAVAMFEGKLGHIDAFMKGKIKIKGNMKAGTKFTPEVFQKPKL